MRRARRWGGGLSRLCNLPSNKTAPLVAVLLIGVQGKILFALRGLLLKEKKLENHWLDRGFQIRVCSLRSGADLLPHCRTPGPFASLGAL